MSIITRKSLFTSLIALAAMGGVACSAASDAANTAASDAKATAEQAERTVKVAASTALAPAANIADAPSGLYKSEAGHAYIAMSYDHQGYARPILRWGAFDATVNVDSENPENSTLEVVIDAASIDSGVERFDQHLVGADFFDVANHPNITFKSSEMT